MSKPMELSRPGMRTGHGMYVRGKLGNPNIFISNIRTGSDTLADLTGVRNVHPASQSVASSTNQSLQGSRSIRQQQTGGASTTQMDVGNDNGAGGTPFFTSLNPSTTYTVSFYVLFATAGDFARATVANRGQAAYANLRFETLGLSGFERAVITFTTDAVTPQEVYLQMTFDDPDANMDAYYDEFQLELGSTATTWHDS